jgi:hypothetical protein
MTNSISSTPSTSPSPSTSPTPSTYTYTITQTRTSTYLNAYLFLTSGPFPTLRAAKKADTLHFSVPIIPHHIHHAYIKDQRGDFWVAHFIIERRDTTHPDYPNPST